MWSIEQLFKIPNLVKMSDSKDKNTESQEVKRLWPCRHKAGTRTIWSAWYGSSQHTIQALFLSSLLKSASSSY